MDAAADLQRAAARTHRQAVAAMVVCTLLWSIAGVITRHLHRHDGSVLVFWRSGFAALSLLLVLGGRRGPAALLRQALAPAGGGASLLWLSGLCWGVMYTAFMVALSLTTVAQTLVAESLGPLFAALMGLLFLGVPVRARTWAAIAVAMLGMAWMFWNNLHASTGSREVAGLLIGLLVPVAAAGNWVALRHAGARLPMQLAPMLGAALSAASMALFSSARLTVDAHDLAWLAVLGVFQLALPGAFAVWAAQRLAPAEVALLGLLEVVFGTLWAWLGAAEVPSSSTLLGGGLILAALVGNELLASASTRSR